MGKTAKDKRDIYYRKAKEEGYRARSAYKLLQIAQHFNLFENVSRVIDLCGAPGGWSQVFAKHFAKQLTSQTPPPALTNEPEEEQKVQPVSKQNAPMIVTIDLQPIEPIPGVHVLQGDITRASVIEETLGVFGLVKADMVVCDGAPDITRNFEFDQYVQHQLVLTSLDVALRTLRAGGCFISKVFRGKDFVHLYRTVALYFDAVHCSKPRSSRNSSVEGFIVGIGFVGEAAVAK